MKKGDKIKIALYPKNQFEYTEVKEVEIDYIDRDIIECVSRVNNIAHSCYTVKLHPSKILRRNDIKNLTKWAVLQEEGQEQERDIDNYDPTDGELYQFTQQ